MIPVQIASQVTADGVGGLRWVLLESAAPDVADAGPAAAVVDRSSGAGAPGVDAGGTAPSADAAAPASTADGLHLWALKGLVVLMGFGAALWTAHLMVGPPPAAAVTDTTRASPPPSLPPAALRPPAGRTQALPVPPRAVPHPGPQPAPAASAALSRLTASL